MSLETTAAAASAAALSGIRPAPTSVTVAVTRLPERVVSPEPKRVLAASAPWLAALLNLLPGLGTGYIYQRRWRAWWITSLVAITWMLLSSLLAPAAAADPTGPTAAPGALLGPAGLLLLSLATAAEAFLAARKARHD